MSLALFKLFAMQNRKVDMQRIASFPTPEAHKGKPALIISEASSVCVDSTFPPLLNVSNISRLALESGLELCRATIAAYGFRAYCFYFLRPRIIYYQSRNYGFTNRRRNPAAVRARRSPLSLFFRLIEI